MHATCSVITTSHFSQPTPGLHHMLWFSIGPLSVLRRIHCSLIEYMRCTGLPAISGRSTYTSKRDISESCGTAAGNVTSSTISCTALQTLVRSKAASALARIVALSNSYMYRQVEGQAGAHLLQATQQKLNHRAGPDSTLVSCIWPGQG